MSRGETMKSFQITIITTVLVLLIHVINAAPQEPQLRTPLGRLIPQSTLSSLISKTTDEVQYEDRIHELTGNLRLLTHGHEEQLNSVLGAPKELGKDDVVTFVDGKLRKGKSVGSIRRGGGYTLVSNADGAVVHLEVPGKVLQPLDLERYPGVFVSVRENSNLVTFGPDIEVASFPSESVVEENIPDTMSVSQAEPSCMGASAPPQFVQLAVAVDNIMCAKYSNNANNVKLAVLGMFEEVNAVYKVKMCIRFIVSVFDIHCNAATDPYSSVENPLPDFREIWPTRPAASEERDVVVFITGTNFLGGVAGQAYVGTTCLSSFSYAWFDSLFSLVAAHELGHNLNASHVDDGVMKSAIDLSKDNYFSDESVREIVTFVDGETSRSSCINLAPASTPPPAALTCDSTLSKWQSIACVDNSINWRTRVKVSTDGFSGRATVSMNIVQQFGFAVTATAPRKVTLTNNGLTKTTRAEIRSIKVLSSFTKASKKLVNSQKTSTVRDGRSLTGFDYPGDVSLPPDLSTCCGNKMVVNILLKIRVFDGNGFDRTYAKLARSSVELSCKTFSGCRNGFTTMSTKNECPVCTS